MTQSPPPDVAALCEIWEKHIAAGKKNSSGTTTGSVFNAPVLCSVADGEATLKALRALAAEIAELHKAVDELDGDVGFNVVAFVSRGDDTLVDKFREFYKPEQWLGSHRAAGAFIGTLVAEQAAEIERLTKKLPCGHAEHNNLMPQASCMTCYHRERITLLESRLAASEKAVEEARTELQDLLNEMALDYDGASSYDVYQITKGEVERAKAWLAARERKAA